MAEHVILAHDDLDGWASAGLARLFLGYDAPVEYLTYDSTIPFDRLRGHHVFLLDLGFPPAVLATISAASEGGIWIDHHASSLRQLEESKRALSGAYVGGPPKEWTVVVDDTFCAARLTFNHLFPLTFPPGQIPEFVRLVDAHDRWIFTPEEKPILAAFQMWAEIEGRDLTGVQPPGCCPSTGNWWRSQLLDFDVESLRREGEVLQAAQKLRVAALLRGGAQHTMLDWAPAKRVNVHPADVNETLQALLDPEEPGTIAWGWYHVQKDGLTVVNHSLRSLPDGPDVSVLAQKYGGGGHAHAAGWHERGITYASGCWGIRIRE